MVNYFGEVQKIKTHRSGQKVSLHKPILLLLTISEVIRGNKNLFLFDEIEYILTEFLSKYGLKNTKELKPHYPFIYLGSAKNIWNCTVDKHSLAHPNSASRSDLMGATAEFTQGFLEYVREGKNGIYIIKHLLFSYWPEAYHEDILKDLGLSISADDLNMNVTAEERTRSRQFVEEVLDAYERKCAVCMQSIRLGDVLVGIDACHLKPIQHYGSDDISNGLALCKIHHWALDRGAFSINRHNKVIISPKLNGYRLEDYYTSFDNHEIFIPRNESKRLSETNINYHYNYIFLK